MTLGIANPAMVTVLLSTYNGSKFLGEQLNSLYQQTYPNIRILGRDDGSTDSTRGILDSEQAKGCIDILEGHNNLGPALSFFELLCSAAATETEYIAFCDQDDVWLPGKIALAVAKLRTVTDDRPAMYCSSVELVDENLEHIGYTDTPRKIGFGNALVESVAVGCTMVLNRKAIDLLCANLPTKVVVHDWWCYLVVSCFGEVLFDEAATLKYRQHGGNAIGVAPNSISRLLRQYKRFFGGEGGHRWISEQALLLRDSYQDDIPLSNRHVLNKFIEARSSWYHRLRLALSSDIWRQKRLDNLILRLLILINRV